ncbi:MAG: phosphotransferase [Myxococcota bacterium]
MTPDASGFELEPQVDLLDAWLRARGWLDAGERVTAAGPAGAGNMNRTLRVATPARTFVLKQSRPWVVKYPDIPAPVDRIHTELRFYDVAHRDPALSSHMPRVLAFDRTDRVAMLEDLGEAADLASLYAGGALEPGELETLCALARRIHALALDDAERASLANRAMRELNHAHLFAVPLDAGNGLDLDAITPGLRDEARALQRDDSFRARVAALGDLYLHAAGPSLLHGDYYPGSILRTARGLCVIDPEFAFVGPVELDLGVLVAHLVFAGEAPAIAERVEALYGEKLDGALLRGFAGVELMRRLIGVAQLPLDAGRAGIDAKRAWLGLARGWVAKGS